MDIIITPLPPFFFLKITAHSEFELAKKKMDLLVGVVWKTCPVLN